MYFRRHASTAPPSTSSCRRRHDRRRSRSTSSRSWSQWAAARRPDHGWIWHTGDLVGRLLSLSEKPGCGQLNRQDRGRILDELVALIGHHRKHAARVLRGGTPTMRTGPRPGRRIYDDAARQALMVVWETADELQQAAEGAPA